MSVRILNNIIENRILYSTSLLGMSLFLGQAPLSIAFIIWILTIPLNGLKNLRLQSRKEKLILLPVFYGSIGSVISLGLIENLSEATVLLKYVPFILMPLGLWAGKDVWKENRNIRFVYLTFLATACSTFILSLLVGGILWLTSGNSIYITYNHLSELFGVQPIYLSLFYLIAILIAMELYLKESTFPKAYLLAVVLLLIGIVLLASRSSLAIALLIVIIRFYLITKSKKRFILFMFMGLILGASVIASIPTLRDRVINFNQNVASYSGTNFRYKIWTNAFEVGKKSPVWGYGYTNTQDKLQEQFEKVNFRRAYLSEMNAHNQYIQTFLDNGAIGVIILILMLILPMIFLRKSYMMMSFFLIIALALITESFFRRQYGVIFYCLFYTFLIAANEMERKSISEVGID